MSSFSKDSLCPPVLPRCCHPESSAGLIATKKIKSRVFPPTPSLKGLKTVMLSTEMQGPSRVGRRWLRHKPSYTRSCP